MKSIVVLGLAIASVVGSVSANAEASVVCKLVKGKVSGQTYVAIYQGEEGQAQVEKQRIPVGETDRSAVFARCKTFVGAGCFHKTTWVPAKKGPEFQTVEVKGYSHPNVFASSLFPRAKEECESALVSNLIDELNSLKEEIAESRSSANQYELKVNRTRDIGGGI